MSNKKWLRNPTDTKEDPLTHERLMEWLAQTDFIENNVGKRISPLDKELYEDAVQEVWVQVLQVPPEKLMSIWYKGKGKFTNYLKTIIKVNLNSFTLPFYIKFKHPQHNEILLTPQNWKRIEDAEGEVTGTIYGTKVVDGIRESENTIMRTDQELYESFEWTS